MKVPFQNLRALYRELKDDLDSAYFRVMEHGNFILGEEVKLFEKEFANYCGSKYCVGVASGLDALTLALESQGFKTGDEVIVPANTYIATWIAISRAGLVPVPVEARKGTFQMDHEKIGDAITERTRAIMPVHLYFQTPDMDPILELGRESGVKVISDAAQAHGVRYKDRIVGSLCEIECFSFFPTKNLGALGDGGAITTNSSETYEKLLMLRNYGTKRKYVSEIIGYNSRLDELQAAFLRVKMSRLEMWNRKRRELADLYAMELEDSGLEIPRPQPYALPNWHIYPVMSDQRDKIQSKLSKADVESIVHYPIPPYLQGAYKQEHFTRYDFPISTEIANNILSLPMHPYMGKEQVEYVSEVIRS